MSIANRIIKNTGFLYLKMGITIFISLYTTRLILNSLGTDDFGIFNIVGSTIAMLGFLNGSMAGATQRFMSYSEGQGNRTHQKTIFSVSIVLHLLIALTLVFILSIFSMPIFKLILNIPEKRIIAAKFIYFSTLLSTSITIISVPYYAVINAHENMKYFAIVGIIESILKLFGAIYITFTSLDKLIIYGWINLLISFFILLIIAIYCYRNYEECTYKIKRYFNLLTLKEMTSFAGWNLFQTAAAMTSNSGSGMVMNNFFGVSLNAAQGIAQQICGQLMALTNNLTKAINPIITKTEGANDRDKVFLIAESSSKLTFFTTSIIAIPALITMPDILKYWLKTVPEFAVFFASCQLIIALFEQITSGFNSAIIASGNIKGISVTKSIIKLSYLPISYFLYKIGYNPYFSYILLVIIQGIINGVIITTFHTKKDLAYNYARYIKTTLMPSISPFIITMGFCLISSFSFNGIYKIIIAFISCFIVYPFSIFFLGTNCSERKAFKKLIETSRIYILKKIYSA